VNVVSVPVVVRDSSGHAVGNLQKENFEIFDNRKPQEMANTSARLIEKSRSNGPMTKPEPKQPQPLVSCWISEPTASGWSLAMPNPNDYSRKPP
jgi:hypothetical protein